MGWPRVEYDSKWRTGLNMPALQVLSKSSGVEPLWWLRDYWQLAWANNLKEERPEVPADRNATRHVAIHFVDLLNLRAHRLLQSNDQNGFTKGCIWWLNNFGKRLKRPCFYSLRRVHACLRYGDQHQKSMGFFKRKLCLQTHLKWHRRKNHRDIGAVRVPRWTNCLEWLEQLSPKRSEPWLNFPFQQENIEFEQWVQHHLVLNPRQPEAVFRVSN